MKPPANLDEQFGKIAGDRRPPANGVQPSPAQTIENARAWQAAFRTLRIPRGVYKFRTHEEADEWLWQMLTRPRD